MVEETALFEEAEIKKAQEKVNKVVQSNSPETGNQNSDMKCYYCQEVGHKRNSCPNTPKCSSCRRRYHKESECRFKLRGELRGVTQSPQVKKTSASKKGKEEKKKKDL